MNRRTFHKLTAVAVAMVATTWATAREGVSLNWAASKPDMTDYFILKFNEESSLLRSLAYSRINWKEAEYLKTDDGACWLKVGTSEWETWKHSTQDYRKGVTPACARGLMYGASTIVYCSKGAWVRDVKVRDPYDLPKVLMTQRYKAKRYYRKDI